MRKVRASMGTLGVLGLDLVNMDTPPTTAYFQVYTEERCQANCRFCAQASGSSSDLNRIARGIYMPSDLETVVERLGIAYKKGYLQRACIQTELYNSWWEDTIFLIKRIRRESSIPISLSVFPVSNEHYEELKRVDIDDIVVPLDACTAELFEKIKGLYTGGPYSWRTHLDGLDRASQIFGKAGTHLMIGLGESDEDAIKLISELNEKNISMALFSYTYIRGTQPIVNEIPEKEKIRHYRIVQLARYLIIEKLARYSDIKFEKGFLTDYGIEEKVLLKAIREGTAFYTSGCSGCNRPMANETFSKIYNFPGKTHSCSFDAIMQELGFTG